MDDVRLAATARAELAPAAEPSKSAVDALAAAMRVQDHDPTFDRHMYVLTCVALRLEKRLAAIRPS